MNLEEIYEVLKKEELVEIFDKENEKINYKYKEDSNLVIKIKNNYVKKNFDLQNSMENELNKYEQFIKKISEINCMLPTYHNTYKERCVIYYKNKKLYSIDFYNVCKLDTVDFSIPIGLDIYDFEFNILKMINKYRNCRVLYSLENIMNEYINPKLSTKENFVIK